MIKSIIKNFVLILFSTILIQNSVCAVTAINTTQVQKPKATASAANKKNNTTQVKPTVQNINTKTTAQATNTNKTQNINNNIQKVPQQTLQAQPVQKFQQTTPPLQVQAPKLPPQPATNKNEIIFKQKTYALNAIDPTVLTNVSGSFYPGLRGANQMVVYTPLYGLRTNTNEFGTEAIVNGNIVTAISGADSIIPKDGIVISAHGAAKKWMNENIIIGTKVYVDRDNKTLTAYTTSDSFLFSAKDKIKETQDIINYYKNTSYMYDYSQAQSQINKAQDYFIQAEKNPQEVQKYSSSAIEAANLALAHSIPYDKNELKGVWIRPCETTEEAIIKTLDRIHAAGINNIFLETYYHGKTIFPSKTMENYQFISQNEKFAGFDPLKIWIIESHKRGIKLHIWFETFYVGNQSPNSNPKNILAVNPNWANTTKRDYATNMPTPSLSEHGGYFIDPANPDVQEFLEDLIREIISCYCPDGINLDYIRYPQSIAAKFAGYDLSNWGYTEYARTEFRSMYGKDPVDILPDDPMWQRWAKYRQDKIASFVLRISNITKPRNIMLTTVIFPDRQKAIETKMQDWKNWSTLGYVDGFTPLLLTCDPKTASVMIQDVNNNKSPNTALYAGLFVTFMNGSNEDLLRQIHEARKQKANGVVIFDYAHLADRYVNTLTASVFDAGPVVMQQNPCQTPGQLNKQKRKFFKFKKNCG